VVNASVSNANAFQEINLGF